MKTTDLTPREIAVLKRAAAEYLRHIEAGERYDVASRRWIKEIADGADFQRTA